jgi:O-succinylbenzoate synthase
MARDGGASEVLVIKPAIEGIPGASNQRIVVTSYLDHPIGQCFAAYEAGKSGIREICGLQSHGVFAANPFGEELGELSPVFRPPSDKGLGIQ